jgi:hypothetical protein
MDLVLIPVPRYRRPGSALRLLSCGCYMTDDDGSSMIITCPDHGWEIVLMAWPLPSGSQRRVR